MACVGLLAMLVNAIASTFADYSAATELTAQVFEYRKVGSVVALTCWEKENLNLARALSDLGITMRVVDVANLEQVRSVLGQQGGTRLGVVADLACPTTLRLLHLASRLRQFTYGKVWVVFDNGKLAESNATNTGVLSNEDAESIAEVSVIHFGPEAVGQPPRARRKVALLERPPPARPSRVFRSTPQLMSDFGRRALSPLILFVDSDFLWVQREVSGSIFVGQPLAILVQVFRSSMAKDLQVYLSAVAALGRRPVRWMWTMSREDQQDIAAARYDLEGALIRATTVILDMSRFTNIDDVRTKDVDIFPKVQYNIVRNNAQMMNFSMAVYFVASYGWRAPNGTFDGLIGDLERHVIDMGATGVFLRHDRLKHVMVTTELFALRTVLIFRQPPRSSVENIFVLPFDVTLWLCIGSLAVIMIAVLRLQTFAAAPPEGDTLDSDYLSLPDVVMFVMGALCQQGAPKVPQTLSARITTILLFLAALFIFTSYSASIVAILHAPSKAVRTITDLIASPMQVALHNMPYNKLWFEETDDPALQRLYKKKLLPRGDKLFMSHTEGAKRVRNGFFAIQIERNQVYRAISDTFLEHEKCDLYELHPFNTPYLLAIPVPKMSPYKDILSQKLRWQHEVGLVKREHRRWETQSPSCGSTGGSTFVRIGLQEFVPALLVLQYGYIVAVALFLFEKMYYKRSSAVRLYKRIKWRHERRGRLDQDSPKTL